MFSYGSGLAASLFSVKLKSAEGLKRIAETSNFKARLAQRKKISPAEFTDILKRYAHPCHPSGLFLLLLLLSMGLLRS